MAVTARVDLANFLEIVLIVEIVLLAELPQVLRGG